MVQRCATRSRRRRFPSAPTLRAEANGENAINLSWDPPADDGGADISQYELHVSTDGGSNYSRLTSPSASARSYNHTGLQPGDETTLPAAGAQPRRLGRILAIGLTPRP